MEHVPTMINDYKDFENRVLITLLLLEKCRPLLTIDARTGAILASRFLRDDFSRISKMSL